MTEAIFETALKLHGAGRLAQAEGQYRALLQRAPHHAPARHRLGLLLIQTGRLAEALKELQRAVGDTPQDAQLRQHFALLLHRLGHTAEAVREAEDAVALKPDFAAAWSTLGAALLAQNQPENALAALQRAVMLAPNDAEAWKTIGQTRLALDAYDAAREAFEQALRLAPRAITAQLGLCEALGSLGRQEEALTCAERALAVDPGYAPAHLARGTVLKQLGRFDMAAESFQRATELAPDTAAFHRALGETRRYGADDPRLQPLEALLGRELPATQKVELHFALFKAYDDLRRHDEAFAQLEAGNRLYRASLPYDEAVVFAFFDAMKRSFDADAVRDVSRNDSELAVFIVGMPRSGTSLVEQILASHPDIYGAGERQWIASLAREILPGYPAGVTAAAAQELGRRYEEKLRALSPHAKRITDKLPANFRHLGLIHRALPQARIIYLRRDPRDTCFSCYSKLFRSGLNFAYDLGELGRYYRRYEDLMAHWRHVLPPECLLEIEYETLVENFEAEARRLVAFCGLEFDPACLRFYETKRAVRTLSEFQVRRPLFSDSIGRWRAYEPFLAPLIAALS
ncbi:tetratricopeptide (TPR) repeat protein [Rhizomicrobium palustre]|uniref:Tetratricopeptide (TPR) repeat protein n=1 Tax=Rhizomicrobium palustre TaxID=189966 RepID=A0A846MVM9_9PROT|nr:tetratricopeptide repeat-containing sulfotransferase family protein [Rhizomicrobium palustre]NIK87426.1 tetratricopeptide (TPR) repeat protein [Rhizomicrobium palustre]